ncbi:MAG: hypothetical protein ACYDBH_23905, partial [Acidobacteriaceae bacterium]
AVGPFGIFSSSLKNKLLDYADDFAGWVRFDRLFGDIDFGGSDACRWRTNRPPPLTRRALPYLTAKQQPLLLEVVDFRTNE